MKKLDKKVDIWAVEVVQNGDVKQFGLVHRVGRRIEDPGGDVIEQRFGDTGFLAREHFFALTPEDAVERFARKASRFQIRANLKRLKAKRMLEAADRLRAQLASQQKREREGCPAPPPSVNRVSDEDLTQWDAELGDAVQKKAEAKRKRETMKTEDHEDRPMKIGNHKDRLRLLQIIHERACSNRPVTLVSGKQSDFYIDAKQVSLSAEGHLLIGRLIFAAICEYERVTGRAISGVGGLTMGAGPLASATSMTSVLAGRPIPTFLVRKEQRHGNGQWIEGTNNLAPGAEVAIVDDVVTTGGSVLKALTRVREAGFKADLVIALVDRLEGGRAAIEAKGAMMVCLFTRSDFST